jgi:hypothetical protein
MEYNISGMPNYGFLSAKLSDAELAPIKIEIDNIQKNFDSHENQKYNSNLVGNIKREYQLVESQKYAEKLLMPLVGAYDREFKFIENFGFLTKSVPIILDPFWVNFQKKYEFNPTHKHLGLLSFVIWTHVPYDMDDERRLSPGVESRSDKAGSFSFLYNNTIGQMQSFDIPINKSMENVIVMFPSTFLHAAYPFFSSDGYRISVSGNFLFKTD